MSDNQKKPKKLKSGVKIKTKPAVVPKSRKLKRKDKGILLDALAPKRITTWNIIFTIIFGAVLALTIVNSYIYEFLIIPISPFFLNFIIPVLLFIEVFLVLLAFSTYRAKFKFSALRVILTIFTGLIFFPITLVKYHTRYSVKRIMFTGLIIGSLLLSFFTPYFGLISKYRDLPEGQLEEQQVDADWFDSLFEGSAPFYIDGLLDLLDALDLNDSLDTQELGQVHADTGNLGNFLYRWEIKDRYDSSTWEFEASDAVRIALDPSDYGTTGDPDEVELNVTQTVYTATTSLLSNLFTTWSSYYTPHLYDVTTQGNSWDDFYFNESGSPADIAEDGSTNIRFNNRDQLSLQATSEYFGFVGEYNYKTYFALDDSTDKQNLIDGSLDYNNATLRIPDVEDGFARFLQIPSNYDSTSPRVVQKASEWETGGLSTSNTVYEQVVYILDEILRYGFPTSAESDNQGQDRAERFLDPAINDRSFSAFIALAVMALRLNGIPARPVFGFALGDGDSTDRTLALSHFYAWLEVLLPVDLGFGTEYRWGQFQIGPYPDGSNLIYCENTLYSEYNVSVEMLSVPTQEYNGQDVYVTDYGVDYSIRATVTEDGLPAENVNVSFKTLTTAELQAYQSSPSELLAVADDIGNAVTDEFGHAILHKTLTEVEYDQLNPADPEGTTYVIIGYISFTSNGAASFVVLPTGYLSSVYMNTTKQILPNPQNPLETYDFYLVQKGRNYKITSTLYSDEAHTSPLDNRLVTYYVLTEDEMQQLLLGTITVLDLTKIGSAYTLPNGTSTVYSVNQTTQVDAFALLDIDTPYFVAANYGQNYTYTVMLIIDALKSTIDIDSSDLNNFDLDIYLYFEPPAGSPSPLGNEPLEAWIAPEDSNYDTYTDPDALKTYILTTYNSSGPLYNARRVTPPGAITDGSGFYNDTFLVDINLYGVGVFRVIVFYINKWNKSVTFTISGSPASVWSENNSSSMINSKTLVDIEIEMMSSLAVSTKVFILNIKFVRNEVKK